MENASLCKSQILGANLGGCSDWSEAPAAELVNQPEPQLTLISFQGHREGAEFLPKPGNRTWTQQSGICRASVAPGSPQQPHPRAAVTEEKFQQLANLSLIYPWIYSSLRTFPLDKFFN